MWPASWQRHVMLYALLSSWIAAFELKSHTVHELDDPVCDSSRCIRYIWQLLYRRNVQSFFKRMYNLRDRRYDSYCTIWILLVGYVTVFQTGLLCLFAYPLLKHKSRMSNKSSDGNKQDTIISLVKRATSMLLSPSDRIGGNRVSVCLYTVSYTNIAYYYYY